MKILATESLIIWVADNNPNNINKKGVYQGTYCGNNSFYPGKSSIFSILKHLDPFNQVFRKIMEWLILGFFKIIRMWHVIACPMVFILLSGRGTRGEVLKLMKDHLFWAFLTVLVLFSRFLSRLRSSFY